MEPYRRLEHEFADFIGVKHGVSCTSGTSALHLALMALRIGPGDEVIVPNFTMAAVPFAVNYTGATPVFVDCGEDLNINPKLIHEKITPRTRAIIAVHTYGRVCDMGELLVHGLPVIEDCAEAHGASYRGHMAGSLGTLSCFSFYRNKILSAEEGGMVVTNVKELADRMNYLKNMAFDEAHTYDHAEIGYNYRMPNKTAEVLLEKLPFIGLEIDRRKERDAEIVNYRKIPRKEGDVVWVSDILCESQEQRDDMLARSKDTRRFFRPMTTLPMWKNNERGLAHAYSDIGMYFIV